MVFKIRLIIFRILTIPICFPLRRVGPKCKTTKLFTYMIAFAGASSLLTGQTGSIETYHHVFHSRPAAYYIGGTQRHHIADISIAGILDISSGKDKNALHIYFLMQL